MQNKPRSRLSGARRSTIGNSGNKLNAFLQQLNQKNGPGGKFDEIRSTMRWDLQNVVVEFELEESGYYRPKQNLVARNISPGGVALLHSSFFYPDSACRITIPMRAGHGNDIVVNGTIKRCNHLQGMIHELGVEFETPIDTSRIVPKRVLTQGRTEYSNPSVLQGNILLIDGNTNDQALTREYLGHTSIDLTCAASLDEAKASLGRSHDLILLEFEQDCAADVLKHLHEAKVATPVVAFTAMSASQVIKTLGDFEIQGILSKPIEKGTLLTCISDYLGPENAQQPNAA